jgi:hypothetical protein
MLTQEETLGYIKYNIQNEEIVTYLLLIFLVVADGGHFKLVPGKKIHYISIAGIKAKYVPITFG